MWGFSYNVYCVCPILISFESSRRILVTVPVQYKIISSVLMSLIPQQQPTQTSMPRAGFFDLFSLCTLSVLHCPDYPGFCLLSLLYNTHNTNIYALGGIQTRNPSRRAATDLRLRTRDDPDQQDSNPGSSST